MKIKDKTKFAITADLKSVDIFCFVIFFFIFIEFIIFINNFFFSEQTKKIINKNMKSQQSRNIWSSCFLGTIFVIICIILLFPEKNNCDNYKYNYATADKKLRGIISGAITSKGKHLEGGVKAGNEYVRISDDPVIAKLTGGFAGFG